MKVAINESQLLTTAEKLRRVSLERFGPGDECTICEEPVVGFGFCVGCGETITNPMRCSACGADTFRKGVCRECAGNRTTIQGCECSWMPAIVDIDFVCGWHVKRKEGQDTATELCPTYWKNQGREVDPNNRRRLLPINGKDEEERY